METNLYKSGDRCECTGEYLQIETNEKFIISKGDVFNQYQKETGEVKNSFGITENRTAHYKLIRKI